MADKKVIVLVALVIVLLGVGAFQFLGGSQNEAPQSRPREAPKKKTEAKAADEEHTVFITAGPVRDPFARPPEATAPPREENLPRAKGPDGQRFDLPAEPTRLDALQPKVPLEPIPGKVNIPEPPPVLNGCGWEAIGVIVGPVPMALLKNVSGETLLVAEGEKPDPSTRVLAVTPEWVTVRHAVTGTIRLGIGGGVVEKRQ